MSTNAYTGRAGSLGPLFESVEQAKHLERVSERIASYVLQFCARHETFTLQELAAYVQKQSPGAPDSASRILRDLRAQGLINYSVIDRRRSLYRVLSVEG